MEGSTDAVSSRDLEKIAIAQDYTLTRFIGGTRPVPYGIPTTGKQADECQDDASWRSISSKVFESSLDALRQLLPRSSSYITR